jgi:hypothetical protein
MKKSFIAKQKEIVYKVLTCATKESTESLSIPLVKAQEKVEKAAKCREIKVEGRRSESGHSQPQKNKNAREHYW